MTRTATIFGLQRKPVNARVSDEARFQHFVRVTAAEFPAYFRAMRGRIKKLEIGAAERFTRGWVAREITARGAFLEGAEDLIIDCALDRRRLNGFGLVVASLLAVERGRFDDGETLASRAMATDQHETFAQRLFLAARERSPSLRLEVDEWLEGRVCPNPFTTMEIIGSRDAYTCCAAWMPAKLGHTEEDPTLWNGARAAEIRRSVLEGDFGYCSRISCPRIAGRNLPTREEAKEPELRKALDEKAVPAAPRRVLLSYDESCNLSCPSCRSTLVMADQKTTQGLDDFYDSHVSPLLAGASEIKITGSGDPFGSRHFRRVLGRLCAEDAQGPRLQLQTNGVLFDARSWDELGLEGHVRSVWVSIDAATPETYAKLRRGGDFERLLTNLKMLGRLRARDAFSEFRLDFVVQNDNFAELEAFVALAKRVGADGVHLLQLRNWGTFSADAFRDLEVTRPDHPNHERLVSILSQPAFGERFVDLGNLAPLRKEAAAPAVAATVAPKRLVVFGAPRTGTNLLFQYLRAVPQLMVFAELFNDAGVFGLKHYGSSGLRFISQLDSIDYAGERDRRLISRFRADPLAALDHLGQLAQERGNLAYAFKIFPDQVRQDSSLTGLLNHPDLVPVFIHRNPLAMYASLLQARVTNQWLDADTSSVKVAFEPDKYAAWYDAHADWYRRIHDHLTLRGMAPAVLDYDVFAGLDPSDLGADLSAKLAASGLEVQIPEGFEPSLRRQDRTKNVFDRFETPAAVQDAITRNPQFLRAFLP